jgi:hypothetical protein
MVQQILLSLIDVTFIHQRPLMIGALYAITGFFVVGMITLLPHISFLMGDLRTALLVCEIAVLVSGLLVLFLVPETYFLRPALAFDGRVLVQSSTEKVEIYDNWEDAQAEKALPDLPRTSKSRLLELCKFIKPKGGSWHACFYCYIQIIYCFLQPLLFWVLILRCLTSTGLSLIARTYANIPLNGSSFMSPAQLTLFQVSGMVGVVLSWPTSSLLNTKVVRILTVRNKGIREAQFYLPTLLMPVLSMTVALLLYAFSARYQLPFIVYCLSFFLVCFAYTAMEAAASTWVIEAFPRNVVAALTVTSGCLFPVSFGLGFVILPWVKSQGVFGACVQLASGICAFGVVGTTLAFWGKDVRQMLKGRWARSESGSLRPQENVMI